MRAQPARLLRQFALRRIPWPACASNAPLNPPMKALADAVARPEGQLPCLRLAFCLFSLPEEEGAALLRLACAASPLVLAADFKQAERNLELPAAWAAMFLLQLTRGVGRDFLRRGGLEGLVRAAGLAAQDRRPFLGGAAVLLRLRSPGAAGDAARPKAFPA
ncbi:MAG: hypothetical protein E7022_08635 [Desulfovibrio desulfuricans]|nr:hypothetical protein [Desulfovibrio desulfuricans]